MKNNHKNYKLNKSFACMETAWIFKLGLNFLMWSNVEHFKHSKIKFALGLCIVKRLSFKKVAHENFEFPNPSFSIMKRNTDEKIKFQLNCRSANAVA